MIQQFHFWVYIQSMQKHYSKRYIRTYVHQSIIYNNQGPEAPKSPSKDEW